MRKKETQSDKKYTCQKTSSQLNSILLFILQQIVFQYL